METTTPEYLDTETEHEGIAQFATLRSVSYGSRPPREVALDFAINSSPQNAGHEAIVSRAQAFLAFLDPADAATGLPLRQVDT